MGKVSDVILEDARVVAGKMGRSLHSLDGSTVLLTGAGGFLGSYLLDVLVAIGRESGRPCRIVAVDNFQVGLPDRVAHLQSEASVELRTHDVTQPLALEGRVDWIVHAASIASPTFYRRFPLETIDVNVNGTWRMLELARSGARGLLSISSSEVYGDPVAEAIPTPETYTGNVSATGPRACYDESKRLGETLCTTYFRRFGTPVKIIRPFNVYGPGQRLDDMRIIPDLMSAALARRPIVLHSDGRPTRSFCYLRDAAAAILLILVSDEANGEVFNVGNDEEISIRELAELVARLAGPPPLPVELRTSADPDYLTDNPQRRCPDLTKLRNLLGWRPEVGLAEGLGRTLRAYREAGEGA